MKTLRIWALILLSSAVLPAAVTKITLTASASPSAADPVVTAVTVIGHGFPTGTIAPANVTVTLDPSVSGGGPSATTTATKVTVVSGTTERVTFHVPISISLPAATSYQVSIAGTTSTGNSFASSNTASLTVNAQMAITTASPLPTGTVNIDYSQTFVATGGSGEYTWSLITGSLPRGLALTPATGALTGQPTGAGISHFAIKTTDSLGMHTTKAFALTIDAALRITTTSPLPTGTVGVTYAKMLKATGGNGKYSWSLTAGSSLPSGLSLNSGTGSITGQPTSAGPANFTVQVTDTNQATATQPFAMTIDPALVITTNSPLTAADVGFNYSQTITAAGGSGQYSWSISAGSLPASLTLNSGTGAISGQPATAGPANFTIQVTDTNQVSTTKAFTMTVNPALVITTTSPLPAATIASIYSQPFVAAGGAGGYSWSATNLPAWLNLSTSGSLTGTPPASAVDSSFTVKVTDSLNNSVSGIFAVPVTLAITTTSPLPTGQVGVNYSQSVSAMGGTGSYTWSVSVGNLPANLVLTPATGLISGQPTTAAASNFTIQVTDTNQMTASLPFSLTINPAASIQTLLPNTSNAGLTLDVSITGSYTHFVQGITVASFGPGIAVGGAAAGQPGPVTVNSATSATASIAIGASATAGSQNVTVTTGAEQASLANGFSIQAAIPYITVNTNSPVPLAPGFSGFDDEYLINGVEYWDPKYLAMVAPLKPGWIRFPSGSPSMAFDWQTGYLNNSWIAELKPKVITFIYDGLVKSQLLTQAKCGAQFANYATLLKTLGANGIAIINGYTDTNTNSAYKLVKAAQTDGVNILDWELDNEAYCCPSWFPKPSNYLTSAYNPYYKEVTAANPNAQAGVFYEGQFAGLPDPPWDWQAWDTGMAAFASPYWQSISYHVYPILDAATPTASEEQILNGVLAHGTTDYFNSYIVPLIGSNTPVYISEMNSDGWATMAFESTIYNAVFLAEYIARMSTIPQIKAVGVTELYLGNKFNQGIIRAVNDYESYLISKVQSNPNFCTDTSTDPHTQFSFYYSTNALGLEIANTAINSSSATWPTTVNGGPTVPIQGYDSNPVPAIYARGYQGTDGTHYILVTNKSGSSAQVAIEVNGSLLEQSVTVSYISNASDTAENTAANQTNVQIVTTSSANPITVGPYSVTRVQW